MSASAAAVRPLHVPTWAAFGLAVLGGVSAAVQAVVNGGLKEAIGSALIAGVVSNTSGTAVFVVALCCMPSIRAGVVRAWHQKLPWWLFSGGLFGATFAFMGAYATPLVGVAIFAIAHVCGNTLGGLGTDSLGMGPSGRIRLTVFRFVGAALAIVAVSVTQLGHVTGTQDWWLVPLIVCVGIGVAVQGAANGRLNEASRNPMSTGLVNFAVGTVALYLVTGGMAVAGGVSLRAFPWQPWLYLGGVCGVVVVLTTMLAVKTLGVFRMGLGILTGQLSGALVLDIVVAGAVPSYQMMAGVALTAAAVLIASLSSRRNKRISVEPEPITALHHSTDERKIG